MQRAIFLLSALRGGEARLEVGDEVIGMLRADGQADGVRADALIEQLLRRELGVRRRGRVDDEALDVRDVGLSDTGGEGGSSSRVSHTDSGKSGQTQKLTGYGLPAFGTGGGGGGDYRTYSSGYRSQFGAEGMPGAVIVEVVLE